MRAMVVILLIAAVALGGFVLSLRSAASAAEARLAALNDLRTQELDFAQGFADTSFTISPWGGAQLFEPSDERGGSQATDGLVLRFDSEEDSGRQSSHGESDPGAWKFTGFRYLGDVEIDADAESIMASLLTQVGGAHPNWHVARLMQLGSGSMGFVSHPAGMVTICVTPEGRENRWSIGYSFTLMSAPARNGIVGRTGDIGGMQIGKQFFRPTEPPASE